VKIEEENRLKDFFNFSYIADLPSLGCKKGDIIYLLTRCFNNMSQSKATII